jgi:hypothetical protein
MWPDAVTSLAPVYPFNEPGQPILLYEGPIGGLADMDVTGSVVMTCTPEPIVEWTVDPGTAPHFANRRTATILLQRPGGQMQLPSSVRGVEGGWSNEATFGRADVPLKRLVAHWFNLPHLNGPIKLTSIGNDGSQRWWTGRWVVNIGRWEIIFDVRPDYREALRAADRAQIYVMTHVMEIRRQSGATFTANEAEPLLAGLHVGISFALGCWVAPMLPVGENSDGAVMWEQWSAYHCDPARRTNPGWWYHLERSSLAELLDRVVTAFYDPDRRAALRLQMMLAIMATNDRGFVEARVINAAAGLEHLAWQALVLGGRMTEDQYNGRADFHGRRLKTHDRLRMVLSDARISTSIDASLLPTIDTFVRGEQARQGRILDGADLVTQIRNRLVHPQGAQETVYRLDGLVAEVWLLARHYLALLILHSLGFRGTYRDLRKTSGWAGDVDRVPWA